MDLITLDANNQAEKLIENYDSLVWAERYNTVGDFQLVTGNVEEYMELLPEGKVLSLRESNVPMIVETHQIDRKKNEGAKLFIKGRSYESILDRRASVQAVAADLAEWLVVARIPSDVAHYVIYKVCVEGIADAADIFPSSAVQFITPSDYLTSTGPNRQFTVPRGNLLETVISFLQTDAAPDASTDPDSPAVYAHGIRAMRPNSTGTAIGIEIYLGTDRSQEVYFDATRELLDDGTYLFSKVGSANTIYGVSATQALKLNRTTTLTGLDRRVIFHDSQSDNAEALYGEAVRVMSDAHETALFNGSVNHDLSPYIYGIDFNLGDIVRTVGDYGLDERARVTEYIRTEDASGSKAYPTLSTIPEYL
jgi:hypothetical protein